jgi:ABC-type multidrug transport system fused ATPase/permease subunit
VVLEAGRIVQEGTFAQLAARQGPFAALLERQTA